jgi:hypothetical protein
MIKAIALVESDTIYGKRKFELDKRLAMFSSNMVLLYRELPSAMAGIYFSNQLIRPGCYLREGSAIGLLNEAGQLNRIVYAVHNVAPIIHRAA